MSRYIAPSGARVVWLHEPSPTLTVPYSIGEALFWTQHDDSGWQPPTPVQWTDECHRCSHNVPFSAQRQWLGEGSTKRCVNCDWLVLLNNGRCVAVTSKGSRCRQPAGRRGFCGKHGHDWHRDRWLEDLLNDDVEEAARRRMFAPTLREEAERWRSHFGQLAEAQAGDLAARVEPFVYFLGTETHVKVGYSTNVQARVRSLTSIGDTTLRPEGVDHTRARLLGTIRGGQSTETAIHRALRSHRDAGEWFLLNDEVREYIAAVLNTTADNATSQAS